MPRNVGLARYDYGVLLAYVDESYTQDYYFMGAVIVDQNSAVALQQGLDRVALEAQQAYLPQMSRPPELHGHPLFHGAGDWAPLKEQMRALIGVYDKAMAAIAAAQPEIILRGLDCRRHRARYVDPWPEHEVVLQHTLERIDDLARARDEMVLVIADDISDPNRHRARLQEFRMTGTPGYRSTQLTQILDTIHFVPSHHSRLIQAADLVTFMHRRRLTVTESNPRAQRAIERVWSHLRPCIRHEFTTQP